MRPTAVVLAALVALAATGCTREPPRSRCVRVCTREAECAELTGREHDRRECVASCIALERDPATTPLVERHAECVDRAPGCEAVLDCE